MGGSGAVTHWGVAYLGALRWPSCLGPGDDEPALCRRGPVHHVAADDGPASSNPPVLGVGGRSQCEASLNEVRADTVTRVEVLPLVRSRAPHT